MTQKGLTNFKRAITRFSNKYKIDLFYGNYYDGDKFHNLNWYLFHVLCSEMEKGFSIKLNWKRSRIEIYHKNKILGFSPFCSFGMWDQTNAPIKFCLID